MINRRELILLLGGAMAVARPVLAQQKAMPVVGILNIFSPPTNPGEVGRGPIAQGLNQAGFVEGKNVAIERRWAEFHYDRLPALAADLVARKVDVIAAFATPSALAAKSATSMIPIVFVSGDDAVAVGLVASLAQPGGNLTGVSFLDVELMQKGSSCFPSWFPRPG